MAPRRGPGSSSSGGGGGGDDDYDNPYYYDPDAIYSPSDLNALRAQVACAAVLLVAALIVICMMVHKSWFSRNGKRNKSRLVAFLICLISVMVSQACTVATATLLLQGPNTYNDIPYYRQFGIWVLPSVGWPFGILSNALFFGLVLVEITRRNRDTDHKLTAFETLGFVAMLAIFGMAIANWIMGMMARGLIKDTYFFDSGNTTLILSLCYHGIAVLLAVIMLVAAPSKKSAEQLSKTQLSHIRWVARALWIVQAVYLSGTCIAAYLHSARTFTIYTSLSASADVVWIAMLFLLARLAWDSHKSHRADPRNAGYMGVQQQSGPAYGSAVPMQQPGHLHGDPVLVQQSPPVYGNPMATQYDSPNDLNWQKQPNVSAHQYGAPWTPRQ